MVKSLATIGAEYELATSYELCQSLLVNCVDDVHAIVDEQKIVCQKNGCIIMSNKWIDGRGGP